MDSCSSCLHKFFHRILNVRHSGNSFIVVYFDFARAFDEASHAIILSKISVLGIRGNLLQWLHTFLASRSKQFCIISTLFDMALLQGLILESPSIYPFISDIFEFFSHRQLLVHVDDLKNWLQPLSIIEEEIISDINSIFQHTQSWFLNSSPKKCFFISIFLTH